MDRNSICSPVIRGLPPDHLVSRSANAHWPGFWSTSITESGVTPAAANVPYCGRLVRTSVVLPSRFVGVDADAGAASAVANVPPASAAALAAIPQRRTQPP